MVYITNTNSLCIGIAQLYQINILMLYYKVTYRLKGYKGKELAEVILSFSLKFSLS